MFIFTAGIIYLLNVSWFLAPDNWRRKQAPENGQCIINFSWAWGCSHFLCIYWAWKLHLVV